MNPPRHDARILGFYLIPQEVKTQVSARRQPSGIRGSESQGSPSKDGASLWMNKSKAAFTSGRIHLPQVRPATTGQKKSPLFGKPKRGEINWQRPTFARPFAALSSAQQCFTSVFGMGTGGSTALWSPESRSHNSKNRLLTTRLEPRQGLQHVSCCLFSRIRGRTPWRSNSDTDSCT